MEAFSSPAPTTPPPRAPRALLCTGRRRRATSTEERIDVAGRHEHECVNPHGWRWRNGCFAIAEGLIDASEPDRAHLVEEPPAWSRPVIAVMESVTS